MPAAGYCSSRRAATYRGAENPPAGGKNATGDGRLEVVAVAAADVGPGGVAAVTVVVSAGAGGGNGKPTKGGRVSVPVSPPSIAGGGGAAGGGPARHSTCLHRI